MSQSKAGGMPTFTIWGERDSRGNVSYRALPMVDREPSTPARWVAVRCYAFSADEAVRAGLARLNQGGA